MAETLYELFMNAYQEATRIPWRAYGNHSHKLLTSDYGNMKTDELDDLEVVRCTRKDGYWRIVVADSCTA